MGNSKLIALFAEVFASIVVLNAASLNVPLCKVEENDYRAFDSFTAGVDDCASCICSVEGVSCDVTVCQDNVMSDATAFQPLISFEDYNVIKNHLAKRYFSEFEPQRLQIILDMLGCKSIECPQLLTGSKIDYTVLTLNRQEYVGRADKQNKIVIHSTDAEAVNNSPSVQEITTVGYSIKATQYYEATVTKTIDISSSGEITLKFVKFGAAFQFAKTASETRRSSNETTLNAPSQRVVVEPYTKLNVTFNFYQYEDINNYLLDFDISNESTIMHADLDANSNVVFVKKPIGEFLLRQVEFLPTIQYESDTALKIVSRDGKFVLTNFPATEKLTNFGVDVKFGEAEPIPH